jgi:predicted dehydrogenase
MMRPVDLIVVGAGNRGSRYAEYALEYPERLRIVGVAEPRPYFRERLAGAHRIPPGSVLSDWRHLAERPRLADGAIIATQDTMHVEPAVVLAAKGYHLLLEKPMAPDPAGCRRIVEAVEASDIIFSVCHVLRYTPYTVTLKRLLDAGAIGEVVSLQRLEPVGYWHQAHSYVRGNWRSEAESSFMLLTKSCHDLDWIRYIVGKRCQAVSSFGALTHFRRENQPPGAADRCVLCAVERQCPYSAVKIYLGRVRSGRLGWPVDVIAAPVTEANVLAALEEGPYGRCVYACDNDVVDHQVVNLLFEGDRTASFTMTAFTRAGYRRTGIFGTRGELEGDGERIWVHSFLTDRTELHETESAASAGLSGHGGGDYGVIDAFVRAVAHGDRSLILSGPEEALESHLMVFAAEQARRENRVVLMP